VIHNRGRVKPETLEQVHAAMEQLNYQPSTLGRAFYMSRQNNRIGVLISLREPDFQRQVEGGVEDGRAYARQHGVGVLTEYASPDDEEAYLAALDRLLREKLRGLALRGIQSEALSARLRALREEGVLVAAYNEDIQPELRDCYVGENARQGGACGAFLLHQSCPPGGRVLIVGVDPHHYSNIERIQGFKECLRRLSAGSPVQVVYGQGNHAAVCRVVRESLEAFPDTVGVFVSGAGLSGAAQAVDELGLSGRVKVVGYDATEPNIDYLKKGTVQFLIDQAPHAQGLRSVQLLTDAIFQGRGLETDCCDTGILIRTPYNC
jgi:ABC-type sugar transport system substrate-binding protein